MQKSSRSFFLLIFSLFLAGITVLSESCRKMDTAPPATQRLSETEAKFFNYYRSADVIAIRHQQSAPQFAARAAEWHVSGG